MTIKDRQEREREEMRELILNAANKIMSEEGIDKLSVRKIANRIEYSPTIIYHYFRDKDEIVEHQMKRGYQKILTALSSVNSVEGSPVERLRAQTRKYIEAALKMPDEYKAAQLSTSPAILEYTSSLFKGAASKKPALRILTQCLKEIYKDKNVDDSFIELTAQVLAASTFGLIIKLILEKDIGEDQRNQLIDHYVHSMIDGMILGKSLENV
ncbi:MAG: TetR/AcrR family transcriptional regulator [Clostridia bacterium]|nr:TetR/AcrR family transcriptional regulator [Clostridia bacterium]